MSETIRILVVDDEPDVEALITQRFRRSIRKGEMEFVFAGDGVEALELLDQDASVAMVLSDINMPRMDGLSLLAHLNELHQELKTVVVSAYGDLGNIRTAMNRGAFDFVTKPIEFSDLETTIQKTLAYLKEFKELQRQRNEAEMARAALSRYFSPNVVKALSDTSEGLKPGGERREATFLFTDLTGFTHLVENTEPDVIVELLNSYIDGVARIIFAHDGTVMKVIGDAMQATFGAPIDQPSHAADAVACALEIDQFTEEYCAKWKSKGVNLGSTRIGVNTGEAIIGNFGGDSFFDYTAYGDAVNVAARLESANKVLGTRICVSESTVKQINNFGGRPVGKLRLAGKSGSVTAYEPLSDTQISALDLQAYCEAHELLAAGDMGARQAFAVLVGKMSDDPLTLFHLQRSLAGALDVEIDLSVK
ncbi:adenylate/guanylate cyclase domain-containing protein [uncultured Sneathiella sp.]|uniref:adenylate/guanylate cyclase domain-containing protein n=1 Tax=uncultured Sneathiella sp. TaxID=879315 RepID=UPI002599FE81|nr:adenylate/guanylate cyclase domain-containing protein [uncultured Sneathiella sp.]